MGLENCLNGVRINEGETDRYTVNDPELDGQELTRSDLLAYLQSKTKVLVVEDGRSPMELIKMKLRDYTCAEYVGDIPDGVNYSQCDVIWTDWNILGRLGSEVIEKALDQGVKPEQMLLCTNRQSYEPGVIDALKSGVAYFNRMNGYDAPAEHIAKYIETRLDAKLAELTAPVHSS